MKKITLILLAHALVFAFVLHAQDAAPEKVLISVTLTLTQAEVDSLGKDPDKAASQAVSVGLNQIAAVLRSKQLAELRNRLQNADAATLKAICDQLPEPAKPATK